MKRALILAIAIAVPSAARATPCPNDLPVLLVAQDKSGTMADTPDPACPTCPTKWSSAKDAVARLSQKFANRFRFAVEMFPHDSTTFNCTTGTLVTPFPAATSDITAAYTSVAPGGGTPTAVSLDAASAYLKGLKLKEPAYVLLLTDGLPNCNLALDPATCSPSQPACGDASGHGSPSCGAKGCLDDQGANAAAGRVWAASYKVYVLGFDASASANNDKAVLDGIAAAGHTGAAYTASDPASLDAALDAIAFNAATCCKDVCVQGASECASDGRLRKCEMDAQAGCTNWTVSDCQAKSVCSGGVCQSCQDLCSAGQARCLGNTVQTCVAGAGGCTAWVDQQTCGAGKACADGSCQGCDACVAGDHRCSGADAQACELDTASGCYQWRTTVCKSGLFCQQGACQSCTLTCTKDEMRCEGKLKEQCVADVHGCTSWSQLTTCADFCSGGECGACGTTCALGAGRCNGNTVEQCTKDANLCTVWTASGPCLKGQFCSDGGCKAGPTSCAVGDKRCAEAGLQSCQQQQNGCDEWVPAEACKEDETCRAGQCLAQCKDACTVGALQCDATSKQPMTCEKAENGCAAWKSAAACSTGWGCVEGTCRKHCTGAEIETCDPGFVCTGLPDGNFCLPQTTSPDAGVAQTTQPKVDDPSTDPGANSKNTDHGKSLAGGCGCSALPAPIGLVAFAPLLLGLLRRRRG